MDSKKSLILNSALKLFASRGFASTSMRQIAREAGIALGLTYNYYKNKEDLLTAIVEKGILDLKKIHHKIENAKDLALLLEKFFFLIQAERQYWKFFIQILFQEDINPNAYAKVIEQIGGFFHLVETEFARYSKIPYSMFGTMLHGVIFEFLMSGDPVRLNHHKEEISNMLQ